MNRIILFIILSTAIAFHANAQLTGITPDQATLLEQVLQTSITSNGIFIQATTPSGNIYEIKLKQGGYDISLFNWDNNWNNTTVINSDSLVCPDMVTIPGNAPTGLYDLEITTGDIYEIYLNQNTYTLPNAFTVINPDGYVTGNVFNDLNKNGIKDAGETGLGRNLKLDPDNFQALSNANGDYIFPASNGSHEVVLLPYNTRYYFLSSLNDTLPVTVNNDTVADVNFGLYEALSSIVPDTGYKGLGQWHQVVSDEPIFVPGMNLNGNISSVRIYSSPWINVNVTTQVHVIDSFTVNLYINVPQSTSAGSNLDIRFQTTTVTPGYHFLNQKFNVALSPNLVTGSVFFDQNQNKVKDVGEPGINGMKLTLTPDNAIAFTDVNGNYNLGSFGGWQTITPANNVPGLSLFTDSASYTMNVQGIIPNKSFGYVSSLPDYTVDVGDLNIWARCNTNQNAIFNITNVSNVAYDVIVWLKYNPNMTYLSSNIPVTSVSNDTIYWNITGIQPYTTIQVKALFDLPGFGNTLNLTAGVISLDGNGITQLSDQTNSIFPVFCSYDPNDKAVEPPGVFAENFTLMGDTLNYKIRFQNTGNDTAFNVVILDTLDSNLDYNSFELIGSSHSVKTELYNNGALKFVFDNIYLPDSISDEPGSHGYVEYIIVGGNNLPDSTEIHNTAHIIFDFNPAIVTNTTLNTFVFTIPVGINEPMNQINDIIYPNPFSNSALLKFNNPERDMFNLKVVTLYGQSVIPEINTREDHLIIERKTLSTGVYFYSLTNARTGAFNTGKLIVK